MSFRSRALLIIFATIVGFIAIVVVVIASLISGTSSASHGRTFSETLGDARDQLGAGAKVVKIEADGGGVEFEVLSPDHSLVLTRNYTTTTEQTSDPNGAPATGYNNHTDESQRIAKPADVRAAVITLGQLDGDVVEQLWDDAGLPHHGSIATLHGSTWTVGSFSQPDAYQANFDGSGFQQTQSQSGVPDGSTTAKG
jgi:hypothetical protein